MVHTIIIKLKFKFYDKKLNYILIKIMTLILRIQEDVMSRNSKLISENLREEIAKELGVYEQVKQDGGSWANVSSKQCGNIVTKAIEIANRSVENKQLNG